MLLIVLVLAAMPVALFIYGMVHDISRYKNNKVPNYKNINIKKGDKLEDLISFMGTNYEVEDMGDGCYIYKWSVKGLDVKKYRDECKNIEITILVKVKNSVVVESPKINWQSIKADK